MKILAVAVCISFLPVVVESTACADCTTTYDGAIKDATDEVKCTAAKKYITCLETDLAACAAVDLKAKGGVADKAITDLGDKCTVAATSTCHCERTAIKADVTADNAAVCSNAQTAITCLRGTVDAGCSDSRTVAATAYAGQITSKCTGGATATCTCEITHTKATVPADTDQCTAAKALVTCLQDTTDAGCSESRKEVGTFAKTKTDKGACATTDVCDCEVGYGIADIADATKQCTAIKEKLTCLANKANDGCDGSSAWMVGMNARKVLADVTNCDKTDTCTCETDHAKSDLSTDEKKCTETKKKIKCLGGKNSTGCDGSSNLMVGVASRKYLAGVTGCDKTATCTCETDYATADLSTKDNQCSKANTAKECLQKITATETGCDGTSSPTDVIANYAQPLIDEYCGAAASLTGVGFTVGILVMLLEITRRI
ncbi:uncharacterized protein LOC121381861 [Gigantopelta aegis]|uniref:uncharacterized protein LOC121381861 n=1 Tax=Gigantopelta aegis TaxID=1735272 RepID=UPI001B888658|nr:uncharacterized protein LOC121381861 [Gigantopelta aegis]